MITCNSNHIASCSFTLKSHVQKGKRSIKKVLGQSCDISLTSGSLSFACEQFLVSSSIRHPKTSPYEPFSEQSPHSECLRLHSEFGSKQDGLLLTKLPDGPVDEDSVHPYHPILKIREVSSDITTPHVCFGCRTELISVMSILQTSEIFNSTVPEWDGPDMQYYPSACLYRKACHRNFCTVLMTMNDEEETSVFDTLTYLTDQFYILFLRILQIHMTGIQQSRQFAKLKMRTQTYGQLNDLSDFVSYVVRPGTHQTWVADWDKLQLLFNDLKTLTAVEYQDTGDLTLYKKEKVRDGLFVRAIAGSPRLMETAVRTAELYELRGESGKLPTVLARRITRSNSELTAVPDTREYLNFSYLETKVWDCPLEGTSHYQQVRRKLSKLRNKFTTASNDIHTKCEDVKRSNQQRTKTEA